MQPAQTLVRLNEFIDWEIFRPQLETIREKPRENASGRKPFDVVFMFKILILQSLYNLWDAQIEFQIRDRMTFMKFLVLNYRYAKGSSTTITTNKGIASWPSVLADDEVLAGAILDRLLHRATVLNIQGRSY